MENIHVLVRIRPINYKETHIGAHPCCQAQAKSIILDAKKEYQFDYVLGPESTQEEVYSTIGEPILTQTLQGLNTCVFAYGQTGAGKTYTMQGKGFEGSGMGLQPRVIMELFNQLTRFELGCNVKCTYLEIYNEQLIDLLNDGKQLPLTIREDAKRVYVENLTEITVSSYNDVAQLMMRGLSNRHISSTQMNSESSRSHSIFTLYIETRASQQTCIKSKMNFVDLAGSERQKQTSTTGERLKEAANINKSLTTLGLVINALAENPKKFIPYRDSKLTFLLRESLGGNSRTFMIASVSSASSSFQETLSTLKFASRTKNIKTQAIINEEIGGNVQTLRAEIKRLKSELSIYTVEQQKSKINVESDLISQISTLNCQLSETSHYHEQLSQEMMQLREFYENRIKELEATHEKVREESVNGLMNKDNELKDALDTQKEMKYKIDCLNQRIWELKEEVNQLKVKKNEFCLQVNQLQNELNQIKLENNNLKDQQDRDQIIIKEYVGQLEQLQDEKQQQTMELEKRIEQLAFQIQLAKDQSDTDQQTIEYQSNQLERLTKKQKKQQKLQQTKLYCIKDQNNRFYDNFELFIVNTDGEMKTYNQQQQQIKQLVKQRIEILRQQLNDKDMKNQQYCEQIQQIETKYNQLQQNYCQLQQINNQLQQELEQNKLNQEALIKYEQLKNEFLQQKDKLTKFLESYDIINQRLILKENEILKVKSELKLEQTQRLKNLEEIDKLRVSKVQMSNQIMEQEETILQLNCQIHNDTEDQKNKKLYESITALNKANQKLHNDLIIMNRQNKQLNEEKEIMQKKFEERLLYTGDLGRFRKDIGICTQLKEQLEKKNQEWQQLQSEISILDQFFQKVNAKRFGGFQVKQEQSLSQKVKEYFEHMEKCESEIDLKTYQLKTNMQLLQIEQANCNLIKEENRMLKLQLKNE